MFRFQGNSGRPFFISVYADYGASQKNSTPRPGRFE
jgi:hypothetical protein